MRIYLDFNDWWVGLYRGPNHYYMCLLPCVVIRWNRPSVRLDEALAAAIERGIKHDDATERR